MQITGRVVQFGEQKQGLTKVGDEWKSMDFVLQTEEEYPQTAVINIFSKDDEKYGYKADQFAKLAPVGTMVDIVFNLKASQWEGRFYNKLSMWSFNVIKADVGSFPSPTNNQAENQVPLEAEEGELPF